MPIHSYAEALYYIQRHSAETAELREFIRVVVAAYATALDVEDELERNEELGHVERLNHLEADAERLYSAQDEAEARLALKISDGRETTLQGALAVVCVKAASDPRARAA